MDDEHISQRLQSIYLTLPNDLSLTSRRRKFILSQNVQSSDVHKIFQRAKFKLKCVLFWTSIIKEIRIFGTGSSLFDGNEHYKENLFYIMKGKLTHRPKKKENIIEIHKKYVILPHFFWFKIWNVVLCFALIYTCTIMPWVMAFENSSYNSYWFYIDTLIDSIYFLDIIITANLAYRNKHNKLVYTRSEILKNYAKGMLIFDILAIIPFNYLTNSSNKLNTYLKIMRLARMVRLLKALKLNKMLESFSGGKQVTYLALSRIIISLILILLLIHFTSCIWNFLPKLENNCPETWVFRKKQMDKSNGELYLTGIYFAVTTIFTVGFGDYSAYTQPEMVLCIILEIVGIGFYSFVLGVMTSLLTSIDHKEVLLKNKMQMVGLFCKDTHLSKFMSKKMTRELRRFYKNVILTDEEKVNILVRIPKAYRYKITSAMYNGRINSIFFFQEQEKSFFYNYVPRLNFLMFKERETVFSQGDFPEFLYFLITGRVSFVFGKRNLVFKTMVAGSYFGEIGLIERQAREYGALTCCYCEMLAMSNNIFRELKQQFPATFQGIKNISLERIKRNRQDREDIIDLLEITEVRKSHLVEELAGIRAQLPQQTKFIQFPTDWFEYHNNMELQNKVYTHELSVIRN